MPSPFGSYGLTDNSRDTGDCEPRQNDCSRAGTGPGCSQDPEIGGAHKKACLEEAKQNCEVALKDCIDACTRVYQNEFPNQEDGVADSHYLGYYDGSPGQPRQAYVVETHTFNFKVSRAADDRYIGPITEKHIKCMRDCYYQAASDCSTVQCYCGSYQCESSFGSSSGLGVVQPPKDPEEDSNLDPTITVRNYQTVGVSFVTTSSYGGAIELIYSKAFLPGNILWMGDLREVRSTRTTQSYDPATNTMTVTNALTIRNLVDIHLGLCAGEVSDMSRFWAGGNLLYDNTNGQGAVSASGDQPQYVLLPGSTTQKVRKELIDAVGFGRAPAYRDMAVLVLKNFNLTPYTEFPGFKVEISREITDTAEVVQSAAYSGLSSSTFWRVNMDANRILFYSTSGITAMTADGLEEVWTEAAADVIEVSPTGKLITYDGSAVGVYDPGLSAVYGTYLPTLSIVSSFAFRFPDNGGNAFFGLLSVNALGTYVVEEIVDTIPAFPSDSVAIKELVDFDSTYPETAISLYAAFDSVISAGRPTPERSIYTARVQTGASDSIVIKELRLYSADSSVSLLEDEVGYSYEIDASVFGNTTTLNLLGMIPSRTDYSIVFAVSRSGAYQLVKWNRVDGVVWSTTITALPDFGKYAPTTENESETFAYLASDGNVYTVDLLTGSWSSQAVTAPALAGYQMYSSETASILYHASGDTVARLYLSRRTSTEQTLEDIVIDVARRSGIPDTLVDASAVASIIVPGFRSGSDNLDARAVLAQLSDIYGLVVSSEDKLHVYSKAGAGTIAVNADHFELPPKSDKVSLVNTDLMVTVNYLSSTLDGEPAKQTFFLTDSPLRNPPTTEKTFTWSVLESDDRMRQIAEMLAYSTTDQSTITKVSIPPKYIAVTAGDVLSYGVTRRVTNLSLGANSVLEIESVRDDPDKYTDYAPVTGIAPLASRFNVATQAATFVPAPIGVTTRSIEQQKIPASAVYVGASYILEELSGTVNIAPAAVEEVNAPTGSTLSTANYALWGRLITALPDTGTAVFQTFKDHSFTVAFPSAEYAQRILARASSYGAYPDYRTVDPLYNAVIVNKEIIQYGYAEQGVNANEIVFHDLLRGRQHTDDRLGGAVGDIFFALGDETEKYEIAASAAGGALKLLSFSGNAARRADITPDETALYPILPGAIMRRDFVASTNKSALFPLNPHVLIRGRLRLEGVNGFENNDVSVYPEDLPDLVLPELYLLRAPFDPILFEAERTGTGTSYIILRDRLKHRALGIDLDNSGVTYDLSYAWRGSLQLDWNAALEPLVAVLVYTNSYGESLVSAGWNAPATYYDRDTRGITL